MDFEFHFLLRLERTELEYESFVEELAGFLKEHGGDTEPTELTLPSAIRFLRFAQ